MSTQGIAWESQKAGRVLSHGQISALPFAAPVDSPVSLFFDPKPGTEYAERVIVKAKLLLDSASANCPFSVCCWTEPAVMDLPLTGNETLLGQYDIYWGGNASAQN